MSAVWRSRVSRSVTETGTVPTMAREVTTGFFPLMYSRVPASSTQLVRMELPRTALASFGLASFDTAGVSSPTITADVLIGEDGLARAVRFVRPALR